MALNRRSIRAPLAALTLLALAPLAGALAADPGLPVQLRQQLLLKQYEDALPLLQELASQGQPEARYQLALCYLNGTGTERSTSDALQHLAAAAEEGHAKASYLLGSLYYRGKVVPQDSRAAKYYLAAAARDDHRLAKQLMRELDNTEQRPDLTEPQQQRRLTSAARSGNLEMAEDALRNGGRLDGADANGDTPLLMAIVNQHESLALWMLDQGAATNVTDRAGDTPLHLAIKKGLPSVAMRLIEAGGLANATDGDGRTPLMIAVMQEDVALVRALQKAGASPDVQDRRGRSARDFARYYDNPAIDRLMSDEGRASAATGQLDERLDLLERQINDPTSLYFGWPVLATAVAQREYELARHLLTTGADPWRATPVGTNAISLAVTSGQEDLASAMLRQTPVGTPAQAEQAAGLLELAATTNRLTLIRKLMDIVPAATAAARPVAETPLWSAIASRHSEAALMLIGWQSRDRRRDDHGRDLLSLASERGMDRVALALLAQGFETNTRDDAGRTPAWYAANGGHSELLRQLVERGADIDQADEDDRTPLLRAVMGGHRECAAAAIVAGADINRQTRNGNTALILAAEDRPDLLELLLGAGADVSVRNKASQTALMAAAGHECVECVALLIEAGANPRRRNARGQNAYDLAAGNATLIAELGR